MLGWVSGELSDRGGDGHGIRLPTTTTTYAFAGSGLGTGLITNGVSEWEMGGKAMEEELGFCSRRAISHLAAAP
jgi:hypothetical protein